MLQLQALHCVDILDILSSKFGYKVLYWYPVNSEDELSWVLKWTPSSVTIKHLVVVSLGRITSSVHLEGDVPPELKDVFKEPDGVETETKIMSASSTARSRSVEKKRLTFFTSSSVSCSEGS